MSQNIPSKPKSSQENIHNYILSPRDDQLTDERKEELANFCLHTHQIIQDLQTKDAIHKYLTTMQSNLDKLTESCERDQFPLIITKLVINDLLIQGWRFKTEDTQVVIDKDKIEFQREENGNKDSIRSQLLQARDEQLSDDSVRKFIHKMERRRLNQYGWHSIFSLMRDGEELADKLKSANGRLDLSTVIDPYLQVADKETVCSHTGLNLAEVWRYFRYTWVTPNRTVPGRSITILVRDAAAPNHPVIGIAALASSIPLLTVRDKWLGWDSETFLENLKDGFSKSKLKWLINIVQEQIDQISYLDLMDELEISQDQLGHPTQEVIESLENLAIEKIKQHRQEAPLQKSAIVKNHDDWAEWSKTSLYQSKRADSLAKLLRIRLAFNSHHLDRIRSQDQFIEILKKKGLPEAIKSLVRIVKSERMGSQIMDITVCGSIAPYNHILGGKLVSILMFSPELLKFYRDKYSKSESLIASSKLGRKVIKDTKLVALCTTSLYENNPSQYNRIKIPCHLIGGNKDDSLNYHKLGYTSGFGTYHLSSLVTKAIHKFEEHLRRIEEVKLGEESGGGQHVNYIFGEGVSPRLRRLRNTLNKLGFNENFFMHGNRRVIYGLTLASNMEQILLGQQKRPKYFLPTSKPKLRTSQLADFWRQRWLSMRIKSEEILDKVSDHQLSYPIKHGARVILPPDQSQQLQLWDDFD